MLPPLDGAHGPSYVISGILLHIGCGRVTVCDTLARHDSKQRWPAKPGRRCLSLFYPAASLFGDAPRKYSEASVRARDSSLASWTTRVFVRALDASQKPLLHTLGAVERPWMLQRPHASTSPALSQTTHEHHKMLHTQDSVRCTSPGLSYRFAPADVRIWGLLGAVRQALVHNFTQRPSLHLSLSWSVFMLRAGYS
jgi:hypothetical protein